MQAIDFNCDLGEDVGDDAAIVPFISSANIACGQHAGGPDAMRRTLALCRQHDVAVGAHPGFADREHFGRRALELSPESIESLVLYQVGALAALARAEGLRLAHVKPHGALYNLAAVDATVAEAIARAVAAFDPGLVLFGLSGSQLPEAGVRLGLRVAHEAFAERRYEADGTLTPRGHPEAVIADVDLASQQVAGMLRANAVTARGGEQIALRADTICLHGDRPDAPQFARRLRRAIEDAGFVVRAP